MAFFSGSEVSQALARIRGLVSQASRRLSQSGAFSRHRIWAQGSHSEPDSLSTE
jgi:hypothetical protein